jgi:hypothetical protein
MKNKKKNLRFPQKSSRKLHTNREEKMKRFIKIIIVMLLVARGNAFSQEKLVHLLKDVPVNKSSVSFPYSTPLVISGLLPGYNEKAPLTRSYIISQMLLPDQYTRNFGFFCQKELQIEKTTKIPIRFRLGSLDYCNKLEGKQLFNMLSN